MKILVYYCAVGHLPKEKADAVVKEKLQLLRTDLPGIKIICLPQRHGDGDRIDMIDMTYYGQQVNIPSAYPYPLTGTPHVGTPMNPWPTTTITTTGAGGPIGTIGTTSLPNAGYYDGPIPGYTRVKE